MTFIIKWFNKKYGHKAKLWFTDTVSLLYETETTNVYEDFYMNEDMSDLYKYPHNSRFYDVKEYPDNSIFHDVKNKKVIGKMKHGTKGFSIVEFVALKSKM